MENKSHLLQVRDKNRKKISRQQTLQTGHNSRCETTITNKLQKTSNWSRD